MIGLYYTIRNWIYRLFGIKRKLKGKWTLETTKELKVLYGLDCVDEIADILSKEIEKERNE